MADKEKSKPRPTPVKKKPSREYKEERREKGSYTVIVDTHKPPTRPQ